MAGSLEAILKRELTNFTRFFQIVFRVRPNTGNLTMSYEILYLVLGVILGAIAIYAILSRRMYSDAQSKAGLIASRLFEMQRGQLEQSMTEMYSAKFGEWKATELAQTVQMERLDALEKSRSVLKGKIGEQLAPLLPEFLSLYNPSEARFLGSPIDYVVFKNLSSESQAPIEIVLVDVKTGNSTLTRNERRIEEAVAKGRVRFQTLWLASSLEKNESHL